MMLLRYFVRRSCLPPPPGAASIVLVAFGLVESRSSELVATLLGRTIVSMSFLFVLNDILMFYDGYGRTAPDLEAPYPPFLKCELALTAPGAAAASPATSRL